MNKYSDTNCRGHTDQRGTGWLRREDLAQVWRQLNGISSQDTSTLIITHGPDGPTFNAKGAAFPNGSLKWPHRQYAGSRRRRYYGADADLPEGILIST